MLAIVPLKDFLIDPEKNIDLSALPEQEAIALIKKSFPFLSSDIEISIRNGMAQIKFPEAPAAQVENAIKLYERGVKQGERGNYKEAISLFKRTLEILPNHTDARRNLAMAHLELGNKEKAKNHLIELLALDPKDEWALVLLGNIYMKHEDKHGVAEKFYRRAYELNPNDAILLTNYGALMAERRNFEQAEEHLERAVKANPNYPNAYFGLALVLLEQNKPEVALTWLDELFAKSKYGDVRAKTVYAEGRRLYLEANKKLAEKSHDLLMQYVEEKKRDLGQQTGYRIDISRDDSLEYIFAVTQMAWKHGRDHHIIKYRDMGNALNPHHLIHELEHISLEHAARQAGRNRVFKSTARTREHAIRSISDDVYKLKQMGYTEEQITQTVLKIVDGLAGQLFNIPLDMVIEHRIHANYPPTRASQFVSLFATQAESVGVLTNKQIKLLTPPRIFRANIALNCAYALFTDSLYDGKTEYAQPYRTSDAFATGQKLFALWQATLGKFQPGDEYALVDEFARLLKLDDWFEWGADDVKAEPNGDTGVAAVVSPQGATNPKLLKAKESAAIIYFLDVLERFEKLSPEQIKQIGFEIGTRGMEGIDYASTEHAHTLKAFPGESFTGLQMLCFMYAAFQVIDLSVETQLDLKGAYEKAVALHQARAN